MEAIHIDQLLANPPETKSDHDGVMSILKVIGGCPHVEAYTILKRGAGQHLRHSMARKVPPIY